ncbi:MAG: hypothetical protein ABSA40_01385 [Candidatus Dormibacteria bacterium]|jgi:hypothetical protein
MRVRDLIATAAALAVIAAAIVTAGILLLLAVLDGGAHVDGVGWALIGVGVVIALAGVGLLSVAVRSGRRQATRRDTAASAPSAAGIPVWGMGDAGEAGGGVVTVGARGGGSPRPVGFSVSHLDVPLIIVGLLLWTAVVLVFFAPHCAAGASSC